MTTLIQPTPVHSQHHHAQPAILVEMPPSPALTAEENEGAGQERRQLVNEDAGKLLIINDTKSSTPPGDASAQRPQSLVSLTSSQRNVAVIGAEDRLLLQEEEEGAPLASTSASASISDADSTTATSSSSQSQEVSSDDVTTDGVAATTGPRTLKGLRRMSRKQAPVMTESLVDLSQQLQDHAQLKPQTSVNVFQLEPIVAADETVTPPRVQRGASESAALPASPSSSAEAHKRPSLPTLRKDSGAADSEQTQTKEQPPPPSPWRRSSAARLFARKPSPAVEPSPSNEQAPVSPKSQPRALPLLESVSRKFVPVIPTRWQSLPASEDPSSEQAKLRYHYQPRFQHTAARNANYPYFQHAAGSGAGVDHGSLATLESEGAEAVVLHLPSDERRPSDGTFTSEFTLSPRPHRERNGSTDKDAMTAAETRGQPTELFSSSPSPPRSPPSSRAQPSAFGFGKSRSMTQGLAPIVRSSPGGSNHDASSQTSSQADLPSTPTLTPTQTRTAWTPRGATRSNSAMLRTQRNASVWSTLEALEAEEQLDKLRLEQLQAESRSPHGALHMRRFTPAARREKKVRKKLERQIFEAGPDRLPSARELLEVSEMEVYNAEGDKVTFGQILGDGRDGRKTIVIFIRHWYCPLCGQYVDDIVRSIDKDALEAANVELVVIGLGSPRLLPAYSRVMKCPFRMYTDPTLKLYRGLGMTLKTFDEGNEEDKGDYIVKTSGEATLAVMKRAIKMPLGMPGSVSQLGGEFIFQGSMTCMYAHRMTNTRAHAPIRDVAALAGVKIDYGAGARRESGPSPPPLHRQASEDDDIRFGNWGESGLAISPEERLALEARVDHWRVEREKELERIRLEREERRAAIEALGGNACSMDTLSL